MYINPIFRPLELHLGHFSFGEWERSLDVTTEELFVRKRGSSIIFWKVFILKPIFSSEKHFHVSKNNFSLTSPFSILTQSTFLQTWNTFSSSNFPWDRQTNPRLHLHFSSKTHESDLILDWHMFLMIQHAKFNLRIHVSNLIFFIKTSVLHMKFTVWPACQGYQFQHQIIPYFHKTWWWCPKHLKIHILAFVLFRALWIFELSSCDSSPTVVTNGWQGFKSW